MQKKNQLEFIAISTKESPTLSPQNVNPPPQSVHIQAHASSTYRQNSGGAFAWRRALGLDRGEHRLDARLHGAIDPPLIVIRSAAVVGRRRRRRGRDVGAGPAGEGDRAAADRARVLEEGVDARLAAHRALRGRAQSEAVVA